MADDITIDENTSAGDLRKALEKANQRAAAAEKRAGELEAKTRLSTVAEILKAKGAPEKAAKFYQGEADEASVTAWLDENKDLFPVTSPGTASTTSTTTPPAAAGAVLDPNDLAAQLVALATAAGGSADTFGMSNLQGAPTIDVDRMNQITELMRTAPRTPEGYAKLVEAGIFRPDTGL